MSSFAHSTPELYDRYLGPLLFEPYAELIAARCALLKPDRILETGAGTGILTRAVHRTLPQAQILATDINPAMLDFAAHAIHSDRVSFQPADAQNLPFADSSFDVVLCQFGVMFFPDKVRASQEARRVLRPDGRYLLLSFDQLELNPVPRAAGKVVAGLFPNDPPIYMGRGPFSYAEPEIIKHDMLAGGFSHLEVESIRLFTRVNAREAAQGFVLGSPFRAEIERRDPSALDRAVDAVAEGLLQWDGKDAPMSAHLVTAKS